MTRPGRWTCGRKAAPWSSGQTMSGTSGSAHAHVGPSPCLLPRLVHLGRRCRGRRPDRCDSRTAHVAGRRRARCAGKRHRARRWHNHTGRRPDAHRGRQARDRARRRVAARAGRGTRHLRRRDRPQRHRSGRTWRVDAARTRFHTQNTDCARRGLRTRHGRHIHHADVVCATIQRRRHGDPQRRRRHAARRR